MPTYRPEIKGTRHVLATGHHFATQAAFEILESGGNAIDAGVSAGLALGVLQSDLVGVAGVAPIMLYLADTREIVTISGLGCWPKAADAAYFRREHGGAIPKGVRRTVVPAAPDAWITALEAYGTMSFGEVAAAAIRFARDGFPMHALMAQTIRAHEAHYAASPASAAIYLPGGRPPEVGEIFRQTDVAATLQHMADQEKAAAKGGRIAGLKAARDAFYKGDIARLIVAHQEAEGGWLTMEDMASFRVGIEPPVSTRFGDVNVYACGPWCQGPALPQTLNLLKRFDLTAMGHNSADYVHVVTEALKLTMTDREAWIGDPRFFDVPIEALLSEGYADLRARLIDMGRAWPEMPPAGSAADLGTTGAAPARPLPGEPALAGAASALDTTYLCVADGKGNVMSATPSDGSYGSWVAPGTGLTVSSRGSQSWTDSDHPSCLAPGKRPRLTPNPAIAVAEGGARVVPFGTPGGDVQTQAMTQVFLNLFAFGMGPQEAVEAPRFASYSFPSSFEPHDYHPGLLRLEGRIDAGIGADLAARGHRVERWPDITWLAGSICAIDDDRQSGLKSAGADPRREAYALGW